MAAQNGDKPRIIRVGDGEYYVDSSFPEKKFMHRVVVNDEEQSCSCGDFTMAVKKDPDYQCEHIAIVSKLNGNFHGVEFFERRRPKLDERFIKNIQGRDFVVYAGVLDLAHQKGLRSIEVEVLQYPTNENGLEAIAKATVESETGEMFTEWGDANPKNVNPKIVRHILRMAATRAKGRALRDYTNIGITCLEELDDLDDASDEGFRGTKPTERQQEPEPPPKKQSKKTPSNGGGSAAGTPSGTKTEEPPKQKKEDPPKEGAPKISTAQLKACENLAKRRGMTQGELEEFALNTFGRKSLDALTAMEASSFIRTLQQSA
jgi:hypothetical protein